MRARCLFTGLLLLSVLRTTAGATTVVSLSNEALAINADLIVIGRCVGLQSVWEGRTLVTVATIVVGETLKGEGGSTVTVALPGGIDANRRFPVAMTYAGAPQIQVTENVFLFLRHDPDIVSGLTVMGFSQGKFSIVADASGAPAVSRDLTQITVESPAGTQRGAATRASLEAFKREIRGYLARP
jgi:hypothetical protein